MKFDPVTILFGALFFGWRWGPGGLAVAMPMPIILRGLLILLTPGTPALDAIADVGEEKAADGTAPCAAGGRSLAAVGVSPLAGRHGVARIAAALTRITGRDGLHAMPRFFAFLGAVNVGGRVIKMDALKREFEALGYTGVSTFIASGNVVFESPGSQAPVHERHRGRAGRGVRLPREDLPPLGRGTRPDSAPSPSRHARPGRARSDAQRRPRRRSSRRRGVRPSETLGVRRRRVPRRRPRVLLVLPGQGVRACASSSATGQGPGMRRPVVNVNTLRRMLAKWPV